MLSPRTSPIPDLHIGGQGRADSQAQIIPSGVRRLKNSPGQAQRVPPTATAESANHRCHTSVADATPIASARGPKFGQRH